MAAAASPDLPFPLPSADLGDEAAVERFRQFLRFDTAHPTPTAGYERTSTWLKGWAEELGLDYQRIEVFEGHPIVVLTWKGRNPSLKSVLLGCHVDVVPADLSKWTAAKPFSADVIDGNVYARGAQDMKIVGSCMLEAIARLIKKGKGAEESEGSGSYSPLRTVHLLFLPDEEVGGTRGMKALIGHALMKTLNPAFALDEGLASPTDKFEVYHCERKIWWLKVRATGPTGHGSRFIEGTAVSKLLHVANKALEYREAQYQALKASCACGQPAKKPEDFTTINLTMLSAGALPTAPPQYNVIPTEAFAGFDIRVSKDVDLAEFEGKIKGWCAEAGEGVSYEWVSGTGELAHKHAVTDLSSAWWARFLKAAEVAEAPLNPPGTFMAASDGRWLRTMLNLPVIGFSPMRNCPVLLHEHNEYVPVRCVLEGIKIYQKLIPVLADTSAADAGETT